MALKSRPTTTCPQVTSRPHKDVFTAETSATRPRLTSVLSDGRFDAVMHFAAKSLVGESVAHPLRYYDVNVGGTATLVQSMQDAGVDTLVFSSTCAIYGDPVRLPLDEAHPQNPVSPYGTSKKMVEEMLAACRERERLKVTTLRYFNAAGCMPDGSLGESHKTETHLIPLAIAAAMGHRPPLSYSVRTMRHAMELVYVTTSTCLTWPTLT